MKTLTLSLKKQWFDMIKAGVKKEEYREIGMFWSVRFLGVTIAKKFNLVDYKFVDAQNIREDLNAILTIDNYEKLVFTLGYPKSEDHERRLIFKNPKIRIGTDTSTTGGAEYEHHLDAGKLTTINREG